MPGPYPAVNIGDINNLDAVFTPGLHLLETSGEDIVSAFINRHIVMPRLNVIDKVIYPKKAKAFCIWVPVDSAA